jgi:hypothetical protein
MLVWFKSRNKLSNNIPTLTCNNEKIELVDSFKYLGVIFDSTLSFKLHFDQVCKKVSSAVGGILLIKRYLPVHTFKVILNTLIFSVIDYCFPIWGHLSTYHLNILQSKVNSLLGSYFFPTICNRFQKFNKISHFYNNATFNSPSINYPELWECCNILSISERLQYFYALFAFKAIRFNWIPTISSNFKFIPTSHSQRLSLPSHKTSLFKKSVFYQSFRTWKNLDEFAKQTDLSLQKFKKCINNWLIGRRSD